MIEAQCINCGKKYRLKGDPQAMDVGSLPCPECGGSLKIQGQKQESFSTDLLIDKPLALIFWDLPQDKNPFLQTLRSLGFDPRMLKRPHHLSQWLRFHNPSLLVLACKDLSIAKSMFEILDSLPTQDRRDIFTLWISPKARSLEPRLAFINSIHLVVNLDDLPLFQEIFDKAQKFWEKFYKPFRMVQAKIVDEL